MKDITPILLSLGLLESEVHTYLQALEHGPSTVLDLAKHTNLSRQATYLAIESLTKRGLMTSAQHEKKRLYAAEDPERLLEYAQRRKTEVNEFIGALERLMPELKLRTGGEKPTVKVYEGKEGIRAIIDDMKNTAVKQSVEIVDLDAMYQVVSPDDLKPMRQAMRKAGLRTRSLLAGQTKSSGIVDADRRQLPKSMGDFRSNMTVYGDKIALVTFAGKMQSIIVESPSLAQMLRVLFELAFEQAQKFPKA